MRSSLARLFVALLVALALVASACGDDGSTTAGADDNGGGDGLTTDDADADGDADDGGDMTADDGDDMTADDGDDMTADDGDDMTGDDGVGPSDLSGYCALAVQADAAGDRFNPATMSSEQIEDHWRTQLALIDQARDLVPADIREHFAVFAEAVTRVIEILEDNGWDFFGALDDLDPIFAAPAVEAADAALDAFDTANCGIAGDDGAGDEGAGDDGGSDQAGIDDSPYCRLSFQFNNEADSGIPFGGPPEAIQTYYDDVLEKLADLRELAPDELKPHIDVIGEGISTLYLLLEDYGFDFTAAADAFEALTAGPEFAEPMDAAAAVLEAYDADVCGFII